MPIVQSPGPALSTSHLTGEAVWFRISSLQLEQDLFYLPLGQVIISQGQSSIHEPLLIHFYVGLVREGRGGGAD